MSEDNKQSSPPGQLAWVYEDEEERQLFDSLRLVQNLALLFAGLIGLSSFWGLRDILEDDGGFSSWIIAAALAIVLAGMLAGAWHILFGIAVRRRLRGQVFSLLFLGGLVLTTIQIATTSWFLATALGGSAALQVHQTALLNDVGKTLTFLQGRTESERGLATVVNRAVQSLRTYHACEIEEGCISGQSGNGEVAANLLRSARSLEAQQIEIETALTRRPTLLSEISAHIEVARMASLEGDERAFGSSIRAAINGLGAAQAVDPSRVLANLQEESPFAEIQAVFSRFRGALVGFVSVGSVPPLPTYQPMDRASATREYADEVGFAWVIAVVIDSLIFALLLIILLAGHLRLIDPVPVGQITVPLDEEPVPERSESATDDNVNTDPLATKRYTGTLRLTDPRDAPPEKIPAE